MVDTTELLVGFFGIKIIQEKHSLTRKLVGYKNWRQKWC